MENCNVKYFHRELAISVTRCLACFTLALLSACGGGGSGSTTSSGDSGSSSGSTNSTPSVPPTDSSPGDSTALADNTVSNGQFDSFKVSHLVIPVDTAQFSGQRVFVKVSTADGALQFLGEVTPRQSLAVEVHRPTPDTQYYYEIFSESSSDPIVYGEVQL